MIMFDYMLQVFIKTKLVFHLNVVCLLFVVISKKAKREKCVVWKISVYDSSIFARKTQYFYRIKENAM